MQYLPRVMHILLVCSFVFASLTIANVHAQEVEVPETENAAEVIEVSTSQASEDEVEEAIETTTLPEETIINTGDAETALDVENIANTNIIDTSLLDSGELEQEIIEETPTVSTTTATGTIETGATSTVPEETTPADNLVDEELLIVTNDNIATTTTLATTTAATGNNIAGGTDTAITTGDAVAYANVLNVVNTNIIDSDGLVTFINDVLGYEDFDLRDTFEDIYTPPDTANSTPSCSLSVCGNGDVNLVASSSNSAYIENDITVIANSGSNQTKGLNSSITTGNAYATANVVNVANTNITDSNYLLLVFNNFDDYDGNLVLPSSSFFENQFQTGTNYNNTSISNNNAADISNGINVGANTGGNTAHGDTTLVMTGDAAATAHVDNTVNTNLFGSESFSMLIRVSGEWDGEIFGLPEGMSWTHTAEGIRLFNTPGGTSSTGVFNDAEVSNTNTATINNNVQVYALTGDNEATGNNASIQTGDAHAQANVLTLANTNIVGQNWANLIFNIYGNWNGNLSFGVPDLWIGAKATSDDSPMMPGSTVTYTFTIVNNGDTDAPSVQLTNTFNPNLLTFNTPERTERAGEEVRALWELGTIPAGQTREISLDATVSKNLEENTLSEVPLFALVESTTPDANLDDNNEYISITTGITSTRTGGNNRAPTFSAHFDIEKTANRDFASPGDTVDYSVSFYNRGGKLYDSMLIDILTDQQGNIISEQSWPLGIIGTWETINIDYSVVFDSETATGTYTNTAQLIGLHKSLRKKYQTLYESPFAEHNLQIQDTQAGQVLGISLSCDQYIHSFMRYGTVNSHSEVMRLQSFLNTFESANIDVTGVFDTATEAAVRDFQQKYADEILAPWGISHNSGFVYLTTRKKINELYCNNSKAFPMTQKQQSEIAVYRTQRTTPKQTPATNPTNENISLDHFKESTREDKSQRLSSEVKTTENEVTVTTTDQRSVLNTLRTRIGRFLIW